MVRTCIHRMLIGLAVFSAAFLSACDVPQVVGPIPRPALPYDHALFAGKILDGATLAGIPNVQVEVSHIGTAVTTADGRYRFPQLAALPSVPSVTIRAEAPGYAPAEVTVSLEQKRLAVPALRLYPKSHTPAGVSAWEYSPDGRYFSHIHNFVETGGSEELVSVQTVAECVAGPLEVWTPEYEIAIEVTGNWQTDEFKEEWVLGWYWMDPVMTATSEYVGYIAEGQKATILLKAWIHSLEGNATGIKWDRWVYPSQSVYWEVAVLGFRMPWLQGVLVPCNDVA